MKAEAADRYASTSRVERALVGALLIEPRLRPMCSRLLPSHFTSDSAGKLWKELMTMKYPDAVLLCHAMETAAVLPPMGYMGWPTYMGSCLDDAACVDSESIGEYVGVILAEAALRKRRPW